ncbi:MAG TPA: hypothetical protein VMU83_19645 [Hanamia sp.]|nr:hypothetical protein [Hanamia sp.]
MSYGRPSYVANEFYERLGASEKGWTEGHEKYNDNPSGNALIISKQLYDKWLPIVKQVVIGKKKLK